MTELMPNKLPAFVQSVSEEVKIGYWEPQNITEWSDVQKTSVVLTVWTQQQQQERGLRKMIGIWVFILISVQIFCVFALVLLDALKLISMNVTVVKLLIPSVLAEVFGMGLLVIKYLFRPTPMDTHIFAKTV